MWKSTSQSILLVLFVVVLSINLSPANAADIVDFQPTEFVSKNGKLKVTLEVGLVDSLDGIEWSSTGNRTAPGYNGQSIGPTLRVKPGDEVSVTLVNNLDPVSPLDRELAAYVLDPESDDINVTTIYNRLAPNGNAYGSPYGFWGLNYVNLHFHAMQVSPSVEQNLDWVDGGGQSKTYEFTIPEDNPSRLYWYHDHVHGKNAFSYMSSLFGFILVEGTANDLASAPGIADAREIFLALSEGLVNPDGSVPPFFPIAMQFNWTGVTNGNDGRNTVFQVNQGEPILFRAVSASVEPPIILVITNSDTTAQEDIPMIRVANDGYPVQKLKETNVITIGGGQRVEFMTRLDTPGNYTLIRQGWKFLPNLEACQAVFNIPLYPCVSFDKDQIVATIVVTEDASSTATLPPLIDTITLSAAYPDSLLALAAQEPVGRRTILLQQALQPPIFQVPAKEGDFGGVPVGFGINNRLSTPYTRHGNVTHGTCETWDIIADPPGAGHPFHTHNVDFLLTHIDGVEVERQFWRDTMMVNQNLTIHICFDKMEPGEVFFLHCHMPSHLDLGMAMAFDVLSPYTDEVEEDEAVATESLEGSSSGAQRSQSTITSLVVGFAWLLLALVGQSG